ncbi:MAG: hypothetical protein ACOYT4_03725 [Nanoarchaeota archaeon]
MRKKISLFGKEISIFAVALLTIITLASAALVPYLSGLTSGNVKVESPIEMKVIGSSPSETCTNANGKDWNCSMNLLGGDSASINLNVKNKREDVSSKMLIELKISKFDGIGIDVEYLNENDSTNKVLSCANDTDMYYYIGPEGGFELTGEESQINVVTLKTAPNLKPGNYSFTTAVILAEDKKC